MRNRLCQARSNPNVCWQTVKSATFQQSLHSSYQQQIKKVIGLINCFNQLLFGENMLQIITSEEAALPEYDLVLNSPITHEEIMISINKLKMGTTQGFDGIGAQLYRNTANILCLVFCSLLNNILNIGVFPYMWAK